MALAEALEASSVVCRLAGQFDENAKRKIIEAGFELTALDTPLDPKASSSEIASTMDANAFDFVVLDSYRADDGYLASFAALEPALVVIDDFRLLSDYTCDAVLNFTWEAPELSYPSGPALLLGPQFLLVRRRLVEQRALSVARDRAGAARKLLVLIGGADPKNLALRLARVLSANHKDLCLRIIAEDGPEIDSLIAQFAPGSAVVPRQPDISDQFLWADVAITGGGLIKYESAYMAVPVAAIAQNEGQDRETRVFSRAGLAHDLGLADAVTDADLTASLDRFLGDASLRRAMASRMRDAFVADPSANAAQTLLEAIER